MNDSFPHIITLLRNERKLTQKQAAVSLGISQALLSHYERGIRECGLDFLVKTADFYGVSCDYLLGRTSERTGAQLTVEDIPEPDTNDRDKRSRGSAVPILNKKLIANSLNVLFDLLQKIDCRAMTSEASMYLMLSVYKVFRIVYLSNPKNPRSFFGCREEMSRGYSSAAMVITESRLEAIASGKKVEGLTAVDAANVPEINDELLLAQYPSFSTSLHSLIRYAESRMGDN